MARRLATAYKHVQLEVTPQQFETFLQEFSSYPITPQIRVYDTGDKELLLHDDGNEIPLIFHSNGHSYIFEGSFIITDIRLNNIMRKAVQSCKGHALVHRVYSTHIMEYHYTYGIVTKIIEIKGDQTTLVFEYDDIPGKLERLFAEQGVEDQIAWIKLQIDQLLDQRTSNAHVDAIDAKLRALLHELFILEA